MPQIELLAPARDAETGMAAVDCGADAVYIGAGRFGAREAAGNSMADVERLIRHAHKYWARVYVTLNTLLRDDEIPEAARLANDAYQAGADALIIQDFGLLECSLPPIPLIASTQMHNDTPEKVSFLEKAGFRRVILARELSVAQIRAIRARTSIELESFVHGALCVCYSGQCYLSYAIGGRSGNRGQCAQPCRLPYSLIDGSGAIIIPNRHLLSIRDLNLTDSLSDLIDAGVCSFKIEGRLKDKSYVRNVVAHYRRALDAILPGLGLRKSSSGQSSPGFEPDPGKTFNRGYTTYFLAGQRAKTGSIDSPKMEGEPVGRVDRIGRDSFTLAGPVELHAGDGISFRTQAHELAGTTVNRVDGNVVYPDKMSGIEPGLEIFRNHDHRFFRQLDKSISVRKIGVRLIFAEAAGGWRLALEDEDGVSVARDLPGATSAADKAVAARAAIEKQLRKLGGTEFECVGLELRMDTPPFIPVAVLNALRRDAVEALREERSRRRPRASASIHLNDEPYPLKELNYLGNVLNTRAEAFFRRHGATVVEPAAESGLDMHGRTVMTTRYCIRYQLDMCPRDGKCADLREPLRLVDEAGRRLRLEFDCAACRMRVIYE